MRDHAFRIAVWIVIASEALLFAGLFALYGAYRSEYPREFHVAASHDIAWIGGVNTIILLASSFAMAVAIHFVRERRRGVPALVGVLVLGGAFLVLKAVEWTMHAREGIVPGAAGELPLRGYSLFFTLYYAMTGLHAAHVIAGLGLVGWMVAYVRAGKTGVALELVGAYWHFVDAVWVFLWPLFYLLP